MEKRRYFALSLLAFCIIFFAGCPIATEEDTVRHTEEVAEERDKVVETAGPIDCGEDMDCFIRASENCEEAKVLRAASVDLFGIVTDAKNIMEIRGMEEGNCIYYQKTIESTVSFSKEFLEMASEANATQEQIDGQLAQANEMAQGTVGLEVFCEFKTPELSSLLKRWNEGSSSAADLAGCEYVLPQKEPAVQEVKKDCVPVAVEGSYMEFAITEYFDYSRGAERVYGKLLPGDTVDLKVGAEIRLDGFRIEADCESCGAAPVNLRRKEAEVFVLLPGKEGQIRTFKNGDKTQLCLETACAGINMEDGECMMYTCKEPVYLHIFDVHAELECK